MLIKTSTPITVDNAVNWLTALDNAMVESPTNMPGLPITLVNDNGVERPCGGFGYSPTLSLRLARWVLGRAAAELPTLTGDALASKIARTSVRASTSFNMISPLVGPGLVSPVVTLTLDNDVAGALLLDTVVDAYDSATFNLPTCKIGVSNLVATTQTLAPASVLAGLAPGVWQSDGAEYNDVTPEFGIVYRTSNGQPIVITATFAHKRPFGYLAAAAQCSASFLCLVDSVPKNCAIMSAQEISRTIAAFETCRV